MRRERVVPAALIVLVNVLLACGLAAGDWMAGTARVDITPGEPIWLSGYASRDRASENVLHPLWVKALAVQDARGQRAVLVTSDTLGFPKGLSDRIRDEVEARFELGRSQIILSASHSHSTPVLDGSLLAIYPLDEQATAKIRAYTAQLEQRTVRVVEEALGALKPVHIASGNGVVRFAVNRRNNRESAIAATHDLNGPIDHAVPVLRVVGENGAVVALVFGYACHATVLSGYDCCGDYPGFAQVALEQAHPECTAMFFAGCGADQNPLPRRSVALAEQYGVELAAAVTRVLAEPMRPLEPTLSTAYIERELLLSEPPSREELESIAKSAPGYQKRCAEALLAQLDTEGSLRASYPYPVQMWRMGAQNLVALGGEVVVDYAVSAKQMLGHDTFVMAYANDFMSYIPTVRVLEEGGYEGDTSQILFGMPSKWRPSIEERILGAIREAAIEVGALKPDLN